MPARKRQRRDRVWTPAPLFSSAAFGCGSDAVLTVSTIYDFPYFSMTYIFTRENFVVKSQQFISLRLHILLQLTNLSVRSENYIWKKYTIISIRYRYADGARNAHVLDCAAMCSPCSRMVRKGWECAGWESDRRGEYAAHQGYNSARRTASGLSAIALR